MQSEDRRSTIAGRSVLAWPLVTWLLVMGLVAVAMPAAAELGLSVDASTATVSGATGDGAVVITGVGRHLDGYESFVRTTIERSLADAGGTVSFTVPWPAESYASWVAVDVATGSVSVETVGHSRVAPRIETRAADDAVAVSGRRMQVLLVRPGTGGWSSPIADGGLRDVDRAQDGMVAISAAELASVDGEAPPPLRGEAGDVIVALDQDSLEVTVMSLVSVPEEEK